MFSCIVLAAGKSTRFKSTVSKVLHKIGGLPIISHILLTLSKIKPEDIFVVTSGSQELESECAKYSARCVRQSELLGSAHAVDVVPLREIKSKYTFVLYGDTPFIDGQFLLHCVRKAENEDLAALVIASNNNDKSALYGKLVMDEDERLSGILESGCDNESSHKVTDFCNHGFLFKTKELTEFLDKITLNEEKGEYFLTDIINIFYQNQLKTDFIISESQTVVGINTRADLVNAEGLFQKAYRDKVIKAGVTLLDPNTIYFSYDTYIEQDVIVYPNVQFMPHVTVKSGAQILGNSVVEGCVIGGNAIVGPFARIRGNTVIMEGARIGNFVEVKNSSVGNGSKINHLSYVGDSKVGQRVNIGAGVITCNYDGYRKHKTTIEDHAFIGSNVSMIAPIRVGKNTIIGAGSTITQDVLEDDLIVARASERVVKSGSRAYREKKCAE